MSTIILEDRGVIPDSVRDYESFREWARSDGFPRDGRFAYLGGNLWVDLSMDEIFTHNLVKSRYGFVLGPLVETARRCYYLTDRVYYSNADALLSTEPDGLFVSFESIDAGRVRFVRGKVGFVEVEGSVDMALEVVSHSSVRKDTIDLRSLYHLAGVREYWLVDARRAPLRFEILRHQTDGYVPVEPVDGWLPSDVFGRSFRLESGTDPKGHPLITLVMQ